MDELEALYNTTVSKHLEMTTVLRGESEANIDPVSWAFRQALMDWCVIITGFLSTFGVGVNIANIIVFTRQGFKDTINISLLGLAVADLACVITMFWSSICLNPFVMAAELPFASLDVMYLTGGWPHLTFNRITSFITAFISLERCLCVTIPLKVKNIITQTRTTSIILGIFIVMFAIFSPFCYVNRLEWHFNRDTNKTRLVLVYTLDREIIETATFLLHSVLLSTLCLIFVLICTIILIVKISSTAKWRKAVTSTAKSKEEIVSVKEKKVVKMISLISLIFVVCFLPGTAIFLAMACDPQISIGGRYENTFVLVWCVGFLLETFNSSFNTVIYFKMSTKFKVTFVQIFHCHLKISTTD